MSAPAPPSISPARVAADTGGRVIAVASTFIVLEIGVVALRFAARIIYRLKWGVDDYLIIPALIFCIGICIIAIVEVQIAGVGRHLDVLFATNPEAVVHWAKAGYAIEQLYCAAVAFPKLSILAMYLRIFTSKAYRYTTYAVGAIITAAAVAGIITSLASCRPFSARWNPQLFVSNCIDAPRFWQALSFPNIITDVVMLLLPLPVVWHLKISQNQRLAVSGVFLLGSFGMIASIIRLTVTFRVTALSDGTWDSADIATWSLVESGCYLIAACLPNLRPFFKSATKHLAHASRHSKTGSHTELRDSPRVSQTAEHPRMVGSNDVDSWSATLHAGSDCDSNKRNTLDDWQAPISTVPLVRYPESAAQKHNRRYGVQMV